MSPAKDKVQPGLTAEAREQLEDVTTRGGFNDMQDAYRLATAIALAEQLPPADASASRTTYLNIGSLDPDGSLRNAVLRIRDDHDDRPVALIERLAEAGVARLHAHMEDGKSLRELLAAYTPAMQGATE
jgi:hypothetical protein